MASGITAIVVSYDDPESAATAVKTLLEQAPAPDEVLVVDNHPSAGAGLDERLAPGARVLRPGHNTGFAGGVCAAAAEATGEWLFLLNPDATPEAGCLRLLLEAAEQAGSDVVGAQVLLPDGATINAGDNPVHITGLCWSGGFGTLREHGLPRAVASVSGAALLVRAEAWRRSGGFHPRFFMYHEDVDLCWRVRLTGGVVTYCPQAAVRHDYAFDKGTEKWFHLERNRWWTILSNYDRRTLLLLAPVVLAAELLIVLRAAREGWLAEKRRAYADVFGARRELRAWRRKVQAKRAVGDGEILALMTGRFDTALMESAVARAANPLMDRYRRVVAALAR